MLPSFFFGSLLALYKDEIVLDWKVTFGLLALGLIVQNTQLKHFLIYLFFATFFVWLASLDILKKIHLTHDISYGIYIWGWPVQVTVQLFYPHLSHHEYILICCSITMLIAFFSALFIEEPFMRLARKINKKMKREV